MVMPLDLLPDDIIVYKRKIYTVTHKPCITKFQHGFRYTVPVSRRDYTTNIRPGWSSNDKIRFADPLEVLARAGEMPK